MILKKPYAFLIKYFRVIHFILLVFLSYTAFKCTKLLSFFRGYIKNNYVMGNTAFLGNEYIPILLYVIIVLSIIMGIAMYVLLNHKKKPSTIYFTLIVYYIILFGFLIYLSGVLNSFGTTLLDSAKARAINDIVLLSLIPQYFFIIVALVRTLGFDIKRFDFASDAKELNLSSEDAEEFELNINLDSYTTGNNFKPFKICERPLPPPNITIFFIYITYD